MTNEFVVTIRPITNGFILKTPDDEYVFEEGDTPCEECQATVRLLYQVLESLGMYGSKHDDYQVRVYNVARDTTVDAETGEHVGEGC